MYGGTCINVGCIPSKSLVKNANLAKLKDRNFEEDREFYRKSVEEKVELITMLRGKNYNKLDGIETVDIIDGIASFVDNHTVKVVTEDQEYKLEADKIFINTCAKSIIPDIEGLKDNPNVYDSEKLMAEYELPRKLTIVGGGYIGLEFASMYSSQGCEVTVLDRSEEFLSREDEDIAQAIKETLEKKGVKIVLNASTTKVDGDVLHYTVGDEDITIEGTKVLLATGRKANTDDLNLENAGVEVTDRGLIKVDDNLKTTADNIWAMGDVCGNQQFTYISLDDYRIVKSALNGGDYDKTKRKNVPYSVFIDPSFSRVGMNEKEAKKEGIEYKLFKMPTAGVPKAQVLQETEGILKVLVDSNTNKILGAMFFSAESYETINIVKLAMDLDAEYTVLRDMIYTHPTMSESINDLLS